MTSPQVPLKNCHRIRGCPASLYLSCPAYISGRNCWEVEEGCMECEGECGTCSVYAMALDVGLASPGKPPATQKRKP